MSYLSRGGGPAGLSWRTALVCLACSLTGCAAVSSPVADGIPVRRLPPEYLAFPREDLLQVPLNYLQRQPPEEYRLGPGDILGVYLEPYIGKEDQPIPVLRVEGRQAESARPALGVPVPVQEDGTITLPRVGPIEVVGKTLDEARLAIFRAFDERRLFPTDEADPKKKKAPAGTKGGKKTDPDGIIVTLSSPRTVRVLVVREDQGGVLIGQNGVIGSGRRGSGQVIALPAYQNDLLTALTLTGGLPGVDAQDEVIIQRGPRKQPASGGRAARAAPRAAQPIRIPLRVHPGVQEAPFRAGDVVLYEGDIVYVKARDTEVFYTGGLLIPRQFGLPRDYSLRVVEAIAQAGGPLINGLQLQNNLSGAIAASGLGSPSPSRATVIRRTGRGGKIRIEVDLYRAVRDDRENIVLAPGDLLILQESPGEAITRYLTTILRFNFFAEIIDTPDASVTNTAVVP